MTNKGATLNTCGQEGLIESYHIQNYLIVQFIIIILKALSFWESCLHELLLFALGRLASSGTFV